AQEGKEPLALELLFLGADHLELDAGADLDRIGEMDGVALPVGLRLRRLDAGGPVPLADEPGLQALGVLARAPPRVPFSGLVVQMLEEGSRGERLDRSAEVDC